MRENLKTAVELAKEGEIEGFDRIYTETCEDVYFRARLMMGNRGEAKALVKQVYLVVFRTIQTLQDNSKMEKWLYTVLYKLGERECRKKKGLNLEEENTAPPWEGVSRPDTTAEKQKIARILKSGYKKLGSAGRLICLACYYEKWKTEDVARIFRIAEEKVQGIREYARIELGLRCAEKGYESVDVSEEMMYLMFELLREDAEEEIRQTKLDDLYLEIQEGLDYAEEEGKDDKKGFSFKWLIAILTGAAVLIGLAAAGGHYLGQHVAKNGAETKKEQGQKETGEEKWSLASYRGNWCDEANADNTVMDPDGLDEINIKTAGNQKIIFDIRHTYGAEEDYAFRGANDVTGVVFDKKASFTFSDESGNRMEGVIEFLDDALKVSVKPASGTQPQGLTAEMECTMKRDAYYGERMTEEDAQEEEMEVSGDYIFPDSDKRLLTEKDFEGKTRQELRLGRNEIFARRGRAFQTKDLNEWFSSKDWYDPKYTAEEFTQNVQLNQYEIENSNRILQAESQADE